MSILILICNENSVPAAVAVSGRTTKAPVLIVFFPAQTSECRVLEKIYAHLTASVVASAVM
jgi:hypothetical protein